MAPATVAGARRAYDDDDPLPSSSCSRDVRSTPMTATRYNAPPSSTLVMTVLVPRTSPSRNLCTARSSRGSFWVTERTPNVRPLPRIRFLQRFALLLTHRHLRSCFLPSRSPARALLAYGAAVQLHRKPLKGSGSDAQHSLSFRVSPANSKNSSVGDAGFEPATSAV